MFVFDVSRKSSFAGMGNWLMECQQYVDKETVKILVCNKCDLERQVTKEEVEKFAQAHSIHVIETSAKTGEGIEEAFMYMINESIQKMPANKVEMDKTNEVDFSIPKEKPKCC